MSLQDQINTDIKTAMKDHDNTRRDTLRMLKSKFQEAQVAKRGSEGPEATLDETEQIQAVTRYAKQLREALEGYEKGGRTDSAKQTQSELEIIEAYLPKQLSDDDLQGICKKTIGELGASSMKEMGGVMKAVQSKTGASADGKRISQIVRTLLG